MVNPPDPEAPVATPRVDAAVFDILSDLQSGTRQVVDADFARTLARELSALSARLAEVERARDEAQEEADDAEKWLVAANVSTAREQKRAESAEARVASLSSALRALVRLEAQTLDEMVAEFGDIATAQSAQELAWSAARAALPKE